MKDFEAALRTMPLIAILRHLSPPNAAEVGVTLADEGFTVVEVPLNDEAVALRCIETLAATIGDRVVVGAGTVTTPGQVERVREAGGRVIVSPDCNVAVIEATVGAEMVSCPGVATPSEAFLALRSGATVLKLFPAAVYGPSGLRALLDVLPSDARVFPVGGVSPDNARAWRDAGAAGLGIGSALFKPTYQVAEISRVAGRFIDAWTSGQR